MVGVIATSSKGYLRTQHKQPIPTRNRQLNVILFLKATAEDGLSGGVSSSRISVRPHVFV